MEKTEKEKEIQIDKSILHNNWYNTVYHKYYSDMMTKNKEKEDNHGDSNQKKWFAFTYCGKEVKYVTKLFKGAYVKMA
jgi:predicted nucleotide-binding protein (sugar kinase/HSP70/actin superfamily)